MRSAPRSSGVRLPALLLAAAAACLPLLGAPAASASVGSVPPEVRAYVTGGGMFDRLDEVYGENADGEGIPFGDTSEAGPISRVFRWTDARLAGDVEGKPVRMANEWAVPITVDAEPVGVAIVWINLDTERPELAELVPDAAAATALAAVPDDAQLVRDVGSGAWFALVGELATPLAAGQSGVTAPTPVDELELAPPAPEPARETADAGFGVAIAVTSVLLVVIVTLLVIRHARTV